MTLSRAKMAEPMEISLGMWTWVGPRNSVLDEGAWDHLVNTIELSKASMCGGDAAFLSNYFYYFFVTLITCLAKLLVDSR